MKSTLDKVAAVQKKFDDNARRSNNAPEVKVYASGNEIRWYGADRVTGEKVRGVWSGRLPSTKVLR